MSLPRSSPMRVKISLTLWTSWLLCWIKCCHKQLPIKIIKTKSSCSALGTFTRPPKTLIHSTRNWKKLSTRLNSKKKISIAKWVINSLCFARAHSFRSCSTNTETTSANNSAKNASASLTKSLLSYPMKLFMNGLTQFLSLNLCFKSWQLEQDLKS